MKNFFNNKNISITGGQGFLGQYVKMILEEKNCKKISMLNVKNII